MNSHRLKEWAQVLNNEIICHWEQSGKTNEVCIEFDLPVKLYVNNNPVSSIVNLVRGDRVTWQIDDPLFRIQVSPDSMKAYLKVIKVDRNEWNLTDTIPCSHLVVVAVEKHKSVVESLTISDVMGEIKHLGIDKHIKLAQLINEVSQPSFQQIIIAEGVEPIPSQDARLELFFREKIENVFRENEGYIDFKNHKCIPQSNPGDVLARKIPIVAGMYGINVYNRPVLPLSPKDILIKPGKHVELNADLIVYIH